MKARIQIPAGWRRIPAADIRKGDRWFSLMDGLSWAKYHPQFGTAAYANCTVIRRVKRSAKAQWVEVDLVQWQCDFSRAVGAYRYSDKTGKPLMTYSQWQQSALNTVHTHFWLRRGAK
jgi:hypothetical protein